MAKSTGVKNVTEGQSTVAVGRRLAWPLDELAGALGTSVGFLRLEIQRGSLRIARLGRRVVVTDQEAQRYLAAGVEAGKPEP